MTVASTWARDPGVARTGWLISSEKVMVRPACSKAGSHSSRC